MEGQGSPDPETVEKMPNTGLHFYFDFISPYGYFAATRVNDIGTRQNVPVHWHAFNMRSVVSNKMGIKEPIFLQPLKGPYFRQDVPRVARYFDLPFNPANIIDFNPTPAERCFWWLHDHDHEVAQRFARRVFEMIFAEATLPGDIAAVAMLAGQFGADASAAAEWLHSDAARNRLKDETEAAAGHGVWGTPTFRIGDQLFWGSDRLGMVEDWLERGGW